MKGHTLTYMMCKRVPYNYGGGVNTEHDADNGNKSVKVKIHVLKLYTTIGSLMQLQPHTTICFLLGKWMDPGFAQNSTIPGL